MRQLLAARIDRPGGFGSRVWEAASASSQANMDNPRLLATLARRLQSDAEAEHIADVVVSTWHQIDAVLTPLIGRDGVAALYKRGVHLTMVAHPWLAGTQDELERRGDLSALRAALARQGSADAAAGGVAFLHTFYTLLTSMVGGSLTDQLLGSVWARSISSMPAQETQP